MKQTEIIKLLSAKVFFCGDTSPDDEFEAVCGCDMMSELLLMMNNGRNGHAETVLLTNLANPQDIQTAKTVLLTNLANPQVIRTAEMVDIRLIVFLRDKIPVGDMLPLAEECGITLASSPYSMYKSCGILYKLKMRDVCEKGGV